MLTDEIIESFIQAMLSHSSVFALVDRMKRIVSLNKKMDFSALRILSESFSIM